MFPTSARRLPRPGVPAVRKRRGPVSRPEDWRAILAAADRACCCPAEPLVIAWMPPSAARPHWTDLLLCHHHERIALDGLLAASAIIVNPRDDTTPSWSWQPARAG